jgi:hypothetical protein
LKEDLLKRKAALRGEITEEVQEVVVDEDI